MTKQNSDFTKTQNHEYRMFKAAKRAEIVVAILGLLKVSFVSGIFAFGLYKTVISLSGKTTDANIAIKLLGDLKFVSSVVFGASGVAYGVNERRLRKAATERLGKENDELRMKQDPKKGSSNLNIKGDSKKEDLL